MRWEPAPRACCSIQPSSEGTAGPVRGCVALSAIPLPSASVRPSAIFPKWVRSLGFVLLLHYCADARERRADATWGGGIACTDTFAGSPSLCRAGRLRQPGSMSIPTFTVSPLTGAPDRFSGPAVLISAIAPRPPSMNYRITPPPALSCSPVAAYSKTRWSFGPDAGNRCRAECDLEAGCKCLRCACRHLCSPRHANARLQAFEQFGRSAIARSHVAMTLLSDYDFAPPFLTNLAIDVGASCRTKIGMPQLRVLYPTDNQEGPPYQSRLSGLPGGRFFQHDERAAACNELHLPASAVDPAAIPRLVHAVDRRPESRAARFRITSGGCGSFESLSNLAATGPRHHRPTDPNDKALRHARTCYDHMAGRLAVAMTDALMWRGLIVVEDRSGLITDEGRQFFADFGIDLEPKPKSARPLCRTCLDWSERRMHLGGRLGAALLAQSLQRHWVRPSKESRALVVTRDGERGLHDVFGVPLDMLTPPI